jgi:hypothetical protein
MAERQSLRKALVEVIRKYEAGQDHDEGSFDLACETCLILADLRRILNERKPES